MGQQHVGQWMCWVALRMANTSVLQEVMFYNGSFSGFGSPVWVRACLVLIYQGQLCVQVHERISGK